MCEGAPTGRGPPLLLSTYRRYFIGSRMDAAGFILACPRSYFVCLYEDLIPSYFYMRVPLA